MTGSDIILSWSGRSTSPEECRMRLLTRVFLLLFAISLASLVFIGRCGLKLEEEMRVAENSVSGPTFPEISSPQPSYYVELLKQKEKEHQIERDKLKQEISQLKKQVAVLQKYQDGIQPIPIKMSSKSNEIPTADECEDYLKKQINAAEIKRGVQLNNEYEVIPFSHFTFSRVYPVELGLGKRVVEKPIGYRRKDLLEVFVRTLEVINKDRHGKQRYTVDDFVEGIYRNEPTTGAQYQLYFREKNATRHYRKVVLMRPFGLVQTISNDLVKTTKELINIILPLSGRIEVFRSFMEKFVKVGIKHDKRIYLTVVYFGEEGLREVQMILTQVSRQTRFRNIKLLTLNETFSRGKGLQAGVHHWTKGEVLLFMCDVDIVFSTKFLERCRLNTHPGKRVYYPIVFSLYNPHIVYTLQGKPIPSETEQLVISRDTGFWRDFGYGMTCQYRSDFINVKGFDEDIVGWGGEDVMLYRKYVRSHLTVVRSTDPGIFHIWHSKTCDPKLSMEQYRACLRSRALSEASHAQLGLLAFGDELKKYQKSSGITEVASAPSSVIDSPEGIFENEKSGREI